MWGSTQFTSRGADLGGLLVIRSEMGRGEEDMLATWRGRRPLVSC